MPMEFYDINTEERKFVNPEHDKVLKLQDEVKERESTISELERRLLDAETALLSLFSI